MGPHITKQTKNMRLLIFPEEKLAITLRFLATGETFHIPMYQFRVHRVTISKCLKDEYFKIPSSEQELESIVDETYKRWHFPNVLAATRWQTYCSIPSKKKAIQNFMNIYIKYLYY